MTLHWLRSLRVAFSIERSAPAPIRCAALCLDERCLVLGLASSGVAAYAVDLSADGLRQTPMAGGSSNGGGADLLATASLAGGSAAGRRAAAQSGDYMMMQ